MSTIRLFGRGYPQSVELFPELMVFPGGEPHVKLYPALTHTHASYIIDARLDDFNGLGMVLTLNDALRRSGADEVTLFCPYLPGARQDRGEPLTAKVYADLINSARFDSVVGVDPHSDTMPALINNFVRVPITEVFPHKFFPGPKEAVLVCPDAGATHRTELVATVFGYDVVYARKHRDFQSGKLTGFSCDPIPDGKVAAIVVDDICDGGGTFLGLAAEIDDVTLHLWVTHGIFSKGLDDLLVSYQSIVCTDSFPSPHLRPDYTVRLDKIREWRA